MKLEQNRRQLLRGVLAAAAGLVMAGSVFAAFAQNQDATGKAGIQILKVPEDLVPGDGMRGEITGKVTGLASFKGYWVSIYSLGGGNWWVQPTEAEPLTPIGAGGEFSAEIHGGEEFAVFLVKDTFKPAAKVEQLPKLGGEVLARDRKKPEKGRK